MNKIAITGIGCIFPGAKTPAQFWDNLVQKKDLTTMVSTNELGHDLSDYFDPTPATPDKICYQKHGFVRDFKLDTQGYRIKAEELDGLDKLFQYALYAANEALKDGAPLRNDEFNKGCGLIIGDLSSPTYYSRLMFSSFYQKTLTTALQKFLGNNKFKFNDFSSPSKISLYNALSSSLPPVVTAKALGLNGPCYSIDAACASAIYCLRLAAQHIAEKQCHSMLVGCLCAPDHLFVSHGFNTIQASPPIDGKSIPFDKFSQGLSLGYGAAFFLVKSYEHAIESKDNIYAVIESIGLSNDGGAQHILAPDLQGQLLALERAYAQVSPSVDYIECHATGTPLGDRTELNTLETFFKDKTDKVLIGANKGAQGHLLTASGMVSLLKVILSMKHNMIPATLGVQNPLASTNGWLSGKNMVLDHQPWEKTKGVRRAGINAFGFGGTNAHLVLSEHTDDGKQEYTVKSKARTQTPLAVVGMGVSFADIFDLKDFTETIYAGKQHFKPVSSYRWTGFEKLGVPSDYADKANFPVQAAYFEQAEIDCIRMKIPPNMLSPFLLNHLFMARVADQACVDAGGVECLGDKNKIAVIVALETDLVAHRNLFRCDVEWQIEESLNQANIHLTPEQKAELKTLIKDLVYPTPFFEGISGGIGNLAAARVSSILKFRGPAFTLASQENSVFKAIELAKFMLATQEMDAVVVGAIDMSASWEAMLWRELHPRRNNQIKIGEGCGAIVLKSYDKAVKDRNRIYSKIMSIDVVQDNQTSSIDAAYTGKKVFETCQNAQAKANIKPEQIDYIELHGSGYSNEDDAEKRGLAKTYYSVSQKRGPIIGSIKANIGHTFVSSGLASVIKTSLCLYHSFLPSTPRTDQNPGYLHLWNDTPFKILNQSQAWPEPLLNEHRMAAINSLGLDGSYSHLILSEPDKDHRINADEFAKECNLLNSATPAKKKITRTLINGGEPVTEVLENPDFIKRFQPKTPQKNTQTLSIEEAFVLLSTNDQMPDSNCVWNQEQILEMTDGRLSNVLGPEYSKIDDYPIRARPPSPPFLFVDKVTKMTAQKGRLEPCLIEWEYRIPDNPWYVNNTHRVPEVILLESSHALLLALSYIGCDAMFNDTCKYRALDGQTKFLERIMLGPGDIFKGQIFFHKFIKNKNRLLIFYEFNGYCNGTQLLNVKANSGFFSKVDLEKAQALPPKYPLQNAEQKTGSFKPLIHCAKKSFSEEDVQALAKGDLLACFGKTYEGKNHIPFVHQFKMLTRILSIDTQGGLGYGSITGEVDITPEHWPFKAHFKNDPVIPGTMLIAGSVNTMVFFANYIGLHTLFKNGISSNVKNNDNSAKFRGEIKPMTTKVQYRLTIKSISLEPEPIIFFDSEIIHKNSIIGICENVAILFSEKK